MTTHRKRWLHASLLAALAGLAVAAYAPPTEGQSGARPQYTADGSLQLPVGFENWVFVGSNLGMAYRRELPVTDAREAARAEAQFFHNVYINPEAYAHFAATKQFPDPTILVMEVFTAADKQQQPVLSTGFFNGERVGIEVAVKDTRRPPVQPTPPPPAVWQYYVFLDPTDPKSTLQTTVKPESSGFCQACHQVHASKDNVWVQFYPTLRKLGP